VPFSHHAREDDMPGVFEVTNASAGQFMFSLKADDGEIIFTSGSYAVRASAKMGIASMRVSAAIASRYKRGTSRDGQHFFVLNAANGESLGRSETYPSVDGIERGIALVKTYAPVAVIRDLSQDR
jgi:uncharacterized protein YegP (UPF0339 family)